MIAWNVFATQNWSNRSAAVATASGDMEAAGGGAAGGDLGDRGGATPRRDILNPPPPHPQLQQNRSTYCYCLELSTAAM